MKNRSIYALGFFDGVHLGHQALLRCCRELADSLGIQTAAITFERHPQALFTTRVPPLINTVADREKLLRQYGMDQVTVLQVTREVMSQPWENFLRDLLEQGAAGFVCGNDFRFGAGGEGNAEKLRAFCDGAGVPCVIVEEQTMDGVRISSSHIRTLLEQGDVDSAVRFLGHPHMLTGTVVPGRQLGRTIGIPTANLHLPEGVVVPRFGVYCCKAMVDGREFPAVTNIGIRPTVQGRHVTVEPWLLDFAGDLYGRELTLAFYSFIRPERKFDSLGELQAEIQKNGVQTREFFENK